MGGDDYYKDIDEEMPRAGKELMENEEVYRMGGDRLLNERYSITETEEITAAVLVV